MESCGQCHHPISDTIVRSIFIVRLWKLKGANWVLAATIILFSLVSFVFSILGIAEAIQDNINVKRQHYAWIALYLSFGAASVADILIAASMSIFLFRLKTGSKRTDSIVRTLISYSISTGAITSLCEISVLLFYAILPRTYICIALMLVSPKLLLNALLASLNAREHLREQVEGQMLSIRLPSGLRDVTTSNTGNIDGPQQGLEGPVLAFRPLSSWPRKPETSHSPSNTAAEICHHDDKAPHTVESLSA